MTSLIRHYYLHMLCETVFCAQIANALGLSHAASGNSNNIPTGKKHV